MSCESTLIMIPLLQTEGPMLEVQTCQAEVPKANVWNFLLLYSLPGLLLTLMSLEKSEALSVHDWPNVLVLRDP